jgi:hypothetical protein
MWKRLHHCKEGVKITRMRNQYKKLCDRVAKLKADNVRSLGYETGMMGPGGGDGNEEQQQKPKNNHNLVCKHCGSASHSRITSTKFPSNAKYKKSQDNPTTSTCAATRRVRQAKSTATVSNLTMIMCLVLFQCI